MTKYTTLLFTILTLGLLILITFASASNLNLIYQFFGSFFNITFYSPFDNAPITINNAHIQTGGHFFIFLLVGLTLRQWLINQPPVVCLMTLIVIAGSSELAQSLAIDRSTSWEDFSVNMLAGSIGILISNSFKTSKQTAQLH